jgi:RNA polymerase sigma factor (sigma-70 family)
MIPYVEKMAAGAQRVRGLTKEATDDLSQDIMLAVIDADPHYDPDRGKAYRSYMHDVGQTVIKRFLSQRKDAVVPLPRRAGEDTARMRAVERELAQRLGREPRHREMAEALGLTMAQFQLLRLKQDTHVHYAEDAPGPDDGAVLDEDYNAPEYDEVEGPEALFEDDENVQILDEFLGGLTVLEQSVLSTLFGLDGDEAQSEEGTAEALGLTRKMVRTYRDSAFRKLKGRGLGEALGIEIVE